MKCKTCGSAEFFVMGSGEKRCKCGRTLKDKKAFSETYANLITKISLLKREIDRCLDDRDQEGFNKYVFELKVCQRYLNKGMNHSSSKRRLEDHFLNK